MIYRKRGRSVRWENGTLIRVSENGWAREEGDFFECGPLRDDSVAERGAFAMAEDLPPRAWTFDPEIRVERRIVTHGIAEHEYGEARWTEETHRVHIALTRGALRVLIDREEDVAPIADALARATHDEREPPPRLRLAPNVTAALLPLLFDVAPPNVRLVQSAGAIDAYGNRVGETSVHFYRPSYRVRPVRAPFDLRLECDVTEIERDRPLAVALLGPIRSLVLPVLIRDGARVYPSRVRLHRIDAVSSERIWYPYGAGSFGAELML
ncbi:MAG TPA: hypothetical protein VHW00_06830 [Thermoanaerobaculia bacterium]|nr:hypothetical protein [Thermoanaerobaculia bacterium]